MRLVRVSRRRSAERCSVCHDALGTELPSASCGQCGTRWHSACREELGRCPTLGCSPAVVAAPPRDEAPRLRAALAWSFTSALVIIATAIVAIASERRDPPLSALASGLFLAGGLVHFVGAPLYWTRRLRAGELGAQLAGLIYMEALGAALGVFATALLGAIALTCGTAALGPTAGSFVAGAVLVCAGGAAFVAMPVAAAWFVGREPWTIGRR